MIDKEPVKLRDIKGVIQKKLVANDKLIISVKTHAKTKYQSYIFVLDQLKQSNATRISIAEPDN
jgi:biopolymer transport protein ExbD